ncbi:DUF5110 domain-containing protein, partial [Belliella pelovolcani]|uniref:DUF5110 domain-containing protein n=1 Tax=Belliella pelovolcani TaxID=529505 RepID=UPI00391B6E4B
ISMQSIVPYTDAKHDGVLHLHIYNGSGEQTFIHYEDDGKSQAHKSGHFYKRSIRWKADKKTLTFSSPEGAYESEFKDIKLYIHDLNSQEIEVLNKHIKAEKENFAFLRRLTEFDPLPDHYHPYFEVKDLVHFTFPHHQQEFVIQF